MLPVPVVLPPVFEMPAGQFRSVSTISIERGERGGYPAMRRAAQTLGSSSQTQAASVGTVPTEAPAWSNAVSKSIQRLKNLAPGWDGPGSVPIVTAALYRAETLIRQALEGRSAALAPFIVPAGDGSIQIEWHKRKAEIELSIESNGDVYLWGRSHVSGHEFEGEGEKALALFFRWAARVATETRDASDVSVSKQTHELIAA